MVLRLRPPRVRFVVLVFLASSSASCLSPSFSSAVVPSSPQPSPLIDHESPHPHPPHHRPLLPPLHLPSLRLRRPPLPPPSPNALSISRGPAGNTYLSNRIVNCGPYPITLYGKSPITLYGKSPPFRVDAIAWPFDEGDVGNQTMLSSLGEGWQTENVTWMPDVGKGTELVMRMVDSTGAVAYSSKKTVKSGKGDRGGCNRRDR
ncbi:hypothetical protein JCM8547_007309 [Rhodosporidiobolus lusitaniae]